MAFFILQSRRSPLHISFETPEEAFAYVCAVSDFTTGAGIEEWSLVERRPEGAQQVFGPGALLSQAEKWREATEFERWRRSRLSPGWQGDTGFA